MVIFDAASYAIKALAVGLLDAHNANPAIDQKRPSRAPGIMRRDLEDAIDEFPCSEPSLGTAEESVTAQVLCLGGQKISGIRPMELNRPMHASPLAPAAIRSVWRNRKLVDMVGTHSAVNRGCTFAAIEKGRRLSPK